LIRKAPASSGNNRGVGAWSAEFASSASIVLVVIVRRLPTVGFNENDETYRKKRSIT
jgi:hypothetical protein